jgi:predicted alpha/beta-hydrolase family hydrolase
MHAIRCLVSAAVLMLAACAGGNRPDPAAPPEREDAGARPSPGAPAPAAQLDAAWASVISQLPIAGLPLLAGGRSAGARVACRTAVEVGATAVLCLAFPVHPPGKPEKTRLEELDEVAVPTLVVQGERDPFGRPPPGPDREVVTIPGTHSLRDRAAVEAVVAEWLPRVLR